MEACPYPPSAVQVHKKDSELEIVWLDGSSSFIPFTELRRYCGCSSCRAKKIVGIAPQAAGSEVVGLELIGRSGLQVQFADGHQRGIYPWPYLFAFSQGNAEEYLYE